MEIDRAEADVNIENSKASFSSRLNYLSLPDSVHSYFKKKKLTGIQMQSFFCALNGDDFHVKVDSETIRETYVSCFVMFAVEAEMQLNFKEEGPHALIVCVDKKAADSILQKSLEFRDILATEFKTISIVQCTSKDSFKELEPKLKNVHIVISTLGTCQDLLDRRLLDSNLIKHVCFDNLPKKRIDEIEYVRSRIGVHQCILVSKDNFNLPFSCISEIEEFRGFHDVVFVERDSRMHHLLQALENTKKRVLIFAERRDAEFIEHFLQTKEINCKSRDDGNCDVLIQSPRNIHHQYKDIMHVINFDLPCTITEYYSRLDCIRPDIMGYMTTFISSNTLVEKLQTLQKHLIQTRQRRPEALDKALNKFT